jgi:hypothetical protein
MEEIPMADRTRLMKALRDFETAMSGNGPFMVQKRLFARLTTEHEAYYEYALGEHLLDCISDAMLDDYIERNPRNGVVTREDIVPFAAALDAYFEYAWTMTTIKDGLLKEKYSEPFRQAVGHRLNTRYDQRG